MFVLDLFEAQQLKTVVILPGGFHPFHPGHLSLYQSAQRAFPGADIFYAATNDKSERPFDIADKKTLAMIAGVPAGHFIQVKSPFQATEITGQYDPNTTTVIFARSEKDKDKPPFAGGVKKDGSASYLQPWTGKAVPATQHAFMAYLPTKQFKAGASGITSATEIRSLWPNAGPEQKAQIVKDLYPKNPQAAMQILDKYLSNGLAEGFDRLDHFTRTVLNGMTDNTWVSAERAYFRAQGLQKKKQTNPDIYNTEIKRFIELYNQYKGQQGVAEDNTAMDPSVIQMKKRAKIAHPFAASDEEALALYVADKSKQAVRAIRTQQASDEKIIDRIDKAETKLEQEVGRIDAVLAKLSGKVR